jgi:hypothetical protein
MSKKALHLLVGVVCAVALTAGSAQANGGDRSTIVFSVQNVNDASAACRDAWFGLSFDMVSPDGAPLGTGLSCVHSIDEGCVPFVAECRQIVRATFTLDFGRGSITAPMKLREILHTEASFTQRGTGRIAGGTGDFAHARGRVKGGGTAAFTDQGLVGEIVYAVHLKGDVDDD